MKSLILLSLVLVIGTVSLQCEGYRILGLFPLGSKSHFMMFEALMKSLARKGHQVDIVSVFPLKKAYPNYTDIVTLPIQVHLTNNLNFSMIKSLRSDIVGFISTIAGNDLCDLLEQPEMLKLIKNPPKDPPYDLVIAELFSATCYFAIGKHLNVPIVAVSTAILYPWLHPMIGNPLNFAFVANNFLSYSPPMTFSQRLYNTVYSVYNILWYRFITQQQHEMVRQIFGPNFPSLWEIEKEVALVLVNSHFSLNDAKPATTALVEVGGLHVENNNEKLPKDLKKWLDDSKDGFVHFTFGSMVTIETLPEEILRALYKSLGKLAPIRVLMKVVRKENLLPGMPKNIHTFAWASQLSILKHKNAKAFITHGGLMGSQEAIYCGVPMIGIPLFIDQFTNVDLYVKKKIAIRLDFTNITEESLDYALNEILYNPIYKKSTMEISNLFRDRPMSATDTAIWWIEYVVRHGNKPLRSAAQDLTWWQIELFDVYACILLISVLSIYLIFLSISFFAKIIAVKVTLKTTTAKKID